MNISIKAKQFCVDAHQSIGQTRKYTGEPYHVHPISVAELVQSRTDDQEIVAAAYLHDVLEDVAPTMPQYGADAIRAAFGERVLSIVVELTNEYTKENYPEMNRKARKQAEAERLAKASEGAKIIKRADLFDNSKSIPESFSAWIQEKETLESMIGRWE